LQRGFASRQPSDFLDFLFLFDQAKRKERIKATMIDFKSAMQSQIAIKKTLDLSN